MAQEIYIIGAGGLAREAFCVLCDLPQFQAVAYVDQDNGELGELTAKGVTLPVITERDFEKICKESSQKPYAVIAVGKPKARKFIAQKFIDLCDFPNIIHPSVVITGNMAMGIGNLITHNCFFTDNITIGDFNLLNIYVTLTHDNVIGHYNVMLPNCNLSGNITVEDENLIGSHSFIIENTSIGSRNSIAAGAVILSNIANDSTYFGNPARKLK